MLEAKNDPHRFEFTDLDFSGRKDPSDQRSPGNPLESTEFRDPCEAHF